MTDVNEVDDPADAGELADLLTESVDPRYAGLDTLSVPALARLMNDADHTVPGAVRAALPQIVPAIEAIAERMAAGGRLLYVGAGTPGRLGVLDASECPPTFNTAPGQVSAIIAGGTDALLVAIEGVEDDAEAGAAAIDEAGIGPLDSVVGIAASGRTPYVIGAVARARERGALTVGLSCHSGARLSTAAELPIEVIVGPEFISGSTRLKSGTAQKLVLNMISTITMVRLGKTYGNLMIDVRATNHKLRERAQRIVAHITGATREDVSAALDAADDDIRVAALMLARTESAEAASERLRRAGGNLRTALEGTS
ncbi:MAG TPA: N-acetylmuramic acid 6-phosphate etherase [Propionibacteriaceae bacterium]|nr:N-acetylmuramic acid 6-phosphate etherase [Propionibacteriaceae bacterium]